MTNNNKKIVNNLKHRKITTEPYCKGLPTNTTNDNPSYIDTLDSMYRELTLIMARYTRVVLVRLDLHAGKDKEPYDVDIKAFRKAFTRKLATKSFSKKSKYTSKIAYQWVREAGRKEYNDGVHWHWWVALKSDKDLYPDTQAELIQAEIINIWEKHAGGASEQNHMTSWFYLKRKSLTQEARLNEQKLIAANPDRPEGILINSGIIKTRSNNKNTVLGGVFDECFYALSYLAKVYSKVRPNSGKAKGDRLFGSSNIGTEDKRAGRQETIEGNLKEIHENLSIQLPTTPVLDAQ